MKLFEEYPHITGERILIRRMTAEDAPALQRLAGNRNVYRYLPTFLYEQKYEDKAEVIARMDEECFRTITAHVMKDNIASAKSAEKNGFLNEYPDIWGDWGFHEPCLTDKYVFKRSWLGMEGQDSSRKIPPVDVEQFVMAYRIEQDRIRAMLPEGYLSLRPVLRINTEIRDEKTVYAEFNTPVEAEGRRGWLNIASWKSSSGDDIGFTRSGRTVRITAPFLEVSYTGTGKTGGCPAEKDNDGTFYYNIFGEAEFRPAEKIDVEKEFCDCSFAWHFHEDDARGSSEGRTLPAFAEEEEHEYDRMELTAEKAAAIPCRQVLGAYIVRFERVRA